MQLRSVTLRFLVVVDGRAYRVTVTVSPAR